MTRTPDTTNCLIPTGIVDRPSPAVYERVQMLQIIEDAMRSAHYCDCGALMTVEAEGDTLWLECPVFIQPAAGRLAWLRTGMREFLHRRAVIAREFGIAA